jgi:hypothetical protein
MPNEIRFSKNYIMQRLFLLGIAFPSAFMSLVATLFLASTAHAQATPKAPLNVGADNRVRVYKLESVELVGSTRMSSEALAIELNLTPGRALNDELVMTTRSKLLGLGLFKSVILVMRKGSTAGMAKLIVEVEDDDSVLGDWALGGELGVTATETSASNTAVSSSSTPLDYRFNLIGRNLFSELHRGSLTLDIDEKGSFRAGQLAYGLPRFAAEDVQFDAEIAAANVQHRYLEALGFGARGQGLWSHDLANGGEMQYGAAMYVNKKPYFAVPGFPSSVAGPKLAYYRETRLRGFFPGEGHSVGAAVLFAPMRTEHSLLEVNLAKTYDLAHLLYVTFDIKALSLGIDGYSVRGESRFDIPLGRAKSGEDQAELFVRLRGGSDNIDKVDLVGSAAIFGVRYHSSGFIAELGIKVTRSPEEFTPKNIGVEKANGGADCSTF